MRAGVIGLGCMGGSLARSAMEKGHRIAGYNLHPAKTEALAREGLDPAFSLTELIEKLKPPRIVVLYIRSWIRSHL